MCLFYFFMVHILTFINQENYYWKLSRQDLQVSFQTELASQLTIYASKHTSIDLSHMDNLPIASPVICLLTSLLSIWKLNTYGATIITYFNKPKIFFCSRRRLIPNLLIFFQMKPKVSWAPNIWRLKLKICRLT